MSDKLGNAVDAIIKVIEYIKNNSFLQITKYILQIAFWIMILATAANYKEVFSWCYKTATEIASEKHDKLTEYRLRINSEVAAILEEMCKECGGSRSYILEFHNGTNNPSGLPFYYMNMTYEYTDTSRTYSGVSEWGDLLISRFNLVSEFYAKGLFVGSIEEVATIDEKMAAKLISNDVKYMGCILLYGKNKPLGILGVSTEKDSNLPYEKIEHILLKYSHKILKSAKP